MIEQLRKVANLWVVALGMMAVALLSGCQTTDTKYGDAPVDLGNAFHIGDLVTVSAVLPSGESIPDHVERISEDGKITLQNIGSIMAAGKTPGELQKEIHDLYVPRYFNELTVTVHGELRYFYVQGEVVARGRRDYPGGMTIVKAIADAGGFTDFAKKTKVQLTHNGRTRIVNVAKAIEDPKYDVPVYAGDSIYVPRRILW